MKVAVRADASLNAGSGHVMRCLTLANELRAHGAEITFVCREHPGHMISVVEAAGYPVIPLPKPGELAGSGYASWLGVPVEQDAEDTKRAIAGLSMDWLVVDHYALDSQWERQLRSMVGRIMVIDDLANRPHDCDVLLDQNFYADMNHRYDGLVEPSTRLLLGPRYALLRPEFRQGETRQRDGTVRRILVFFGGVDATGETEKALDALGELALPDVTVDVVVGASNPRAGEIRERCARMPGGRFHQQVSNMAELMAAADIALGAGGSATWERCCLGLPCVTTVVAENQRKAMNDLAAQGAIFLLEGGFGQTNVPSVLREIFSSPERLLQMGRIGRDLFSCDSHFQAGWPGMAMLDEEAFNAQ